MFASLFSAPDSAVIVAILTIFGGVVTRLNYKALKSSKTAAQNTSPNGGSSPYDLLCRKLDRISQQVERTDTKVERIDGRVERLDARLEHTDDRLVKVETGLAHLRR